MRRALLFLTLVGCFSKPQPNCAFLCGTANDCPTDYVCVAADNRCHLNTSGTPAQCDDTLPADAAVAPPDGMSDAGSDAPNMLTTLSVTPAQLAEGVAGNVTISFTTSNPWPADGKLSVDMSSLYDCSGVTFVSKSGIDGTVAAAQGSAQRIIVFTRSGGTTIAGNTPVSIVVGNVKNPVAMGATSMVVLTTENSTGGPIDSGMAGGVTILGALTSVTVTLSNYMVGATPTTTVTFTIANTWPKDGKLNIVFPSTFVVGTPSINGTPTGPDGGFTISKTGNTVTITRDNTGADFTSGAATFAVDGVTNPAAAGATGPFVITTFQNNGTTGIDTFTGAPATITP
jgi:hypothetical protein